MDGRVPLLRLTTQADSSSRHDHGGQHANCSSDHDDIDDGATTSPPASRGPVSDDWLNLQANQELHNIEYWQEVARQQAASLMTLRAALSALPGSHRGSRHVQGHDREHGGDGSSRARDSSRSVQQRTQSMLVPISSAKRSSDSPSGASSGVIYCATPIRPIAMAPSPAEHSTGGPAAGPERHHSSPKQQPAPSQQSVSVITSSAIRATAIYGAPVAAGISNSSGGGHSSSGHGTSAASMHAQLQHTGTARISTSPGQAQHHHYQLSPLHQYYSPHSARGNLSSRSRSGATPVQNSTPVKRSPSNQTHQQSHHHHHNYHSAPTAAATNASVSADTTSSDLHQHNQQLQQQIKDLSDQLSALQAHTSTLKVKAEQAVFLGNLTAHMDSALRAQTEAAQAQAEQHATDAAASTEKVSIMQVSLARTKEDNELLRARVQQLESRVAAAQASHETVVAERDRARAETEALAKQLSHADTQAISLQSAPQKDQLGRDEGQSRFDDLRRRAEQAEQDAAAARHQLREEAATCASLRAQINDLHSGNRHQLGDMQEQQQELSEKLSEAREQGMQAARAAAGLEAERTALRAALEAEHTSLMETRAKLADCETRLHTAVLAAAKEPALVSRLREEANNERSRAAALSAERFELQRHIGELSSAVLESGSEAAHLRSRVDTLVASHRTKVEALEQAVQHLKGQVESAQSQAVFMEQTLNKWKQVAAAASALPMPTIVSRRTQLSPMAASAPSALASSAVGAGRVGTPLSPRTLASPSPVPATPSSSSAASTGSSSDLQNDDAAYHLHRRLLDLQAALTDRDASIEVMRRDLTVARADASHAHGARASAEKECAILEARIEDLRHTASRTEEQLAHRESEIDDLKTRIRSLDEQLEAHKANAAARAEELQNLQSTVASLHSVLSTARNEREELTMAMRRTREAAASQVGTANDKADAAMREASSARAECTFLHDSTNKLRSQVMLLRKEAESVRADARAVAEREAHATATLSARVRELASVRDGANADLQSFARDKSLLMAEAQRANREAEASRNACVDAEKQITELREQLEHTQKSYTRLQADRDKERSQLVALRRAHEASAMGAGTTFSSLSPSASTRQESQYLRDVFQTQLDQERHRSNDVSAQRQHTDSASADQLSSSPSVTGQSAPSLQSLQTLQVPRASGSLMAWHQNGSSSSTANSNSVGDARSSSSITFASVSQPPASAAHDAKALPSWLTDDTNTAFSISHNPYSADAQHRASGANNGTSLVLSPMTTRPPTSSPDVTPGSSYFAAMATNTLLISPISPGEVDHLSAMSGYQPFPSSTNLWEARGADGAAKLDFSNGGRVPGPSDQQLQVQRTKPASSSSAFSQYRSHPSSPVLLSSASSLRANGTAASTAPSTGSAAREHRGAIADLIAQTDKVLNRRRDRH